VVNTFVIFLSRIVGYVVDGFLRRGDSENSGPGIGYMVTSMICEVVFGLLASIIVAWFSRQREFRADAGAAGLMGSPVPMQNALRRLGNMHAEPLPQNMAASGLPVAAAGCRCSRRTRRLKNGLPLWVAADGGC
jgi:heat shock protein HtpX